jgi:hypothetical protein
MKFIPRRYGMKIRTQSLSRSVVGFRREKSMRCRCVGRWGKRRAAVVMSDRSIGMSFSGVKERTFSLLCAGLW